MGLKLDLEALAAISSSNISKLPFSIAAEELCVHSMDLGLET